MGREKQVLRNRLQMIVMLSVAQLKPNSLGTNNQKRLGGFLNTKVIAKDVKPTN